MPHSLFLWFFLPVALISFLILIVKRWVIPARGFAQLTLFTVSEIAFACNKGLPCSNCPLSFGACPIGVTQRIAFIPQSPFLITLAFIGIIGLTMGTLLCGWACPVGFIQDIFQAPRFKEIKVTDKLKLVRYFALALGVLLVFLELRFHFLSRRGIGVFNETTIITGGLLLFTAALFIKRPCCRVLCPLGLIYGKLNKVSPIKVALDTDKCSACGECRKVCVSGINPIKQVNADLCSKCFNCLKVCPQRGKER